MSAEDQEMLSLFIQEAGEHLETLEADLLQLENNPRDAQRLNRIFRAAHSIKGTAGFFGLTPITDLAHVMESVMSLVRDGRMDATPAIISHLLTSTDKLKLMVAAPDRAGEVPTLEERQALQALLHLEPAPPAPPTPPALPECVRRFKLDPVLVGDALRHDQNLYVIDLRLHANVEAHGHTILDYLNEVVSLGSFIDSVTEVESNTGLGDTTPTDLHVALLFSTAMEPDLLLGAFNLPASQLTEVPLDPLRDWLKTQPTLVPASSAAGSAKAPTPVAPPPATAPAAAARASAPVPVAASAAVVVSSSPSSPAVIAPAVSTPTAVPTPAPAIPPMATPMPGQVARVKPEETIRISVNLLDSLMNLAGEMVLGRNQLVRLLGQGTKATKLPEGLDTVVQSINTVTSELQRTVMRARLQAVGGLFGRFHRVLRDLGPKLGKEFHLETVGDDVELDRTILEGLSDPMTHLVRNAADHGIEPTEERRRLGKPTMGQIRLSAAHLAGHVQIEVRDDGRGLDPDRLRSKAVEKGVITADQAARMTPAEARALIFAPGFSTAAQVTDISGRGVGMDVVKSNIERLGGRVDLASSFGQGTTVIIRLPLTLAIIPALIITQGGRRFAVPQSNLEEIIRPNAKRALEQFGGATMFRLRDELLPVLRLGALLGHPATESDPQGFLLVLALDDRRFGLLVDSIADTEEIVVKPLGRHFKGLPFYSGATLLGQGEIALILDPAGLARGRLQPIASLPKPVTEAKNEADSIERVLLFRDGPQETYALHLANIARVERLRTERIERIGAFDYLRQANGPTLRLLRLHDFLPVSKAGPLPAEVHVIIPRLLHHSIALIADQILDATDLHTAAIDKDTVKGVGILGTLTLADRLTTLLDLYGVIKAAGLAQAVALPANRLARTRILVAEDTALFREAIRRALEGQVSCLDIMKDGELAWQRLQHESYDLIITDIEMPNCDGFELTRRIRADQRLRHIPVIACSARSSDRFLEKAREAGINHYETKLDRDRLLKAIETVLPSH